MTLPSNPNPAPAMIPATIVVQSAEAAWLRRFRNWALYVLLVTSLAVNLVMYLMHREYLSSSSNPRETYHSGSQTSLDKIAIIPITGTIMPPFTAQTLRAIKRAKDDPQVKGVLLLVNSPGGFVADSHQIYHRVKELRETTRKPIYVAMENLAASGGYYVSMGAGPQAKIFAEPTTWTGSIGVIIPHYEVTTLADKVGVKALPLTSGKFKDSLSPFKELSEDDRKLWDNILDQSFEQFLDVIAEGRSNLKKEKIRELATGQIYTARDAKANGLIDEIGYVEDALVALKSAAGVPDARVIKYEFPVSLLSLVSSLKTDTPREQWNTLLDATVPRAMYFASWGGPVP